MRNAKKDEMYFASAYIKAIETGLIPFNRYDRLLDGNIAEMLKQLSSYGYQTADTGCVIPRDFDALIEKERRRLYETISSVVGDARIFGFFLYPYDYLNLKTLLKAEIVGIKADSGPIGSVDFFEMRAAVSQRQKGPMTDRMYEGFIQALDIAARTCDAQKIDLILDGFCFDDMLASALKISSPFIADMVRAMIDTANIKAFLRLRKMNRSKEFSKDVFFNGGTMPAYQYIEKYGAPYDEFLAIMPQGIYSLAVQAADAAEKGGTMGNMERICDNFVASLVSKAKYMPSGPEVVAEYIFFKETELKNVRIILAGKSAGLEKDKILERLRMSYV